MSLWICKTCGKTVRCKIGNLCPSCDNSCERVISVGYMEVLDIPPFDKEVSNFAKELVLKFNTYVNHHRYYNLEEIYQIIREKISKFSLICKFETSTPRIDGDTLTFTICVWSNNGERKDIFMEFNLNESFFTLKVQTSEGSRDGR